MDEDIVQKEKKIMKKYGIIYCAYNKVNQKRYIGQTIQLLGQRKNGHYSNDKDIYFHRALHKYKKEDWEWSVIDTANSKEELDEKEKYWIAFYECCNPDKGYNILEGGNGVRPSQEQIKYARDNFVKLYSNNEEKEIKIRKNILCVETGIVYKSAAEASRQTGIHHSHMVAVANGKLKTAGGYHWEWCIDVNLYPNALYCVELNKVYLTYNEAKRRDHFSNVNLNRAFKKQGSPFQYAGYTFYKLNN